METLLGATRESLDAVIEFRENSSRTYVPSAVTNVPVLRRMKEQRGFCLGVGTSYCDFSNPSGNAVHSEEIVVGEMLQLRYRNWFHGRAVGRTARVLVRAQR